MKRTLPSEGHSKFSGNLRYYHRSAANKKGTWDEWVDGASSKPRHSRNWLKIIGIIAGLLALAGIITGLIIELS